MIFINDKAWSITVDAALSPEQSRIADLMEKYNKKYHYDSVKEFQFDLEVKTHITKAARLLAKSGADFEPFKKSRCNPDFWARLENGAFLLKSKVSPHEALLDIFTNGSLYAFECATAMVIVYYRAVLEITSPLIFDKLFSDLFLFDWEYDKNLDLHTALRTDFLPGDCVYFSNPDFDPETPEWRGENCIVLEEDLYFAHGMGIKTGEEIMDILNELRRSNPDEPAYLEPQLTRLQSLRYYKLRGDLSAFHSA
ncbi:protein-glutamine gamma-glutamyltransferase [Peribacillus kribbensis]|uniref:protein-glutamine gamma-glutamyltransferase n=1 Tax=Peribacillus kribbensis TaxID=356658 RepID=UPI00040CF0E2|nr:protein-glutamine gamma-glutamyltransferase [Peribacillus kribbensis]